MVCKSGIHTCKGQFANSLGLKMKHITSLMAAVFVLGMTPWSSSAYATRNRIFQACSSRGFYHQDIPLVTSYVISNLVCANMCLMRHECLSYFISLGKSKESKQLMECHLSSDVYFCSDLKFSDDHTYFYSSANEWPASVYNETVTADIHVNIASAAPEIVGDNTTEMTSPSFLDLFEETTDDMPLIDINDATSTPIIDNDIWSLVYASDSDGRTVAGDINDFTAKVLQGKSFRLLLEEKDKSQIIDLDAIHVSSNGSKITGIAYIYESFRTGAVFEDSLLVKLEVNTDGEVWKVKIVNRVEVVSGDNNFNAYRFLWFVKNKARTCQSKNPPPIKIPSRVVSEGDDGITTYSAFAIFDAGTGSYGLGLYMSKELQTTGMTISLRKINLSRQTEIETKVNLLTGTGDIFKQSGTWRKSTIFYDTCFDLVLDTREAFYVNPLLDAVHSGRELVVSFVCYDPGAFITHVQHVLEVERVVIEDPWSNDPYVTAFAKNFAVYDESLSLNWRGINVDADGSVYENNTFLKCWDVQFFVGQGQEMVQFTCTRYGGLSFEDDYSIDYYLQRGYLPRLKLEKASGDLEFFIIENADYSLDEKLFLRSYRFVSSANSRAAFHVFTFDVRLCQYSHEVNIMDNTLYWSVPAETQAESMTLFFEKSETSFDFA